MTKLTRDDLLGPGIHYDVPHDVYHADCCIHPSLSSSVAKVMASKAPIHGWLAHPRLNPEFKSPDPSERMKFGSIVHELMLGQESSVMISPWDDFKTKAAREWRDVQFAAGKIPTISKTFDRAKECTDVAMGWMKGTGYLDAFLRAKSEVTVIAKRERPPAATGPDTWMRARFDKLLIDPDGAANRMHGEIALSFDIKVVGDASPEACSRSIGVDYYDMRALFYQKTLGFLDKKFLGKHQNVFLFIESTFPFCVTPMELDNEFWAVAGTRLHRAWNRWDECLRSGNWPTYAAGEGCFIASPPRWIAFQELENPSQENEE